MAATRQQQKGTGLGVRYEEYVPKSEWIDQPEATLLTIDLPGFAKEQIKVTYVHNSKMIRVNGERRVDDKRWMRFNEVFTVPQNCLTDKIHGSFKNNVLTITMPKETITKMDHVQEASKSVAEEEKRLLEEAKRKQEAEQKKMKLLEEREGLIRKLKEEAEAKEKAEMMRKREEEAKAKEKAEMMRKREEEAKAKEKSELMRKLEEEVKALERELVEEATKLEKSQKRKPVDESRGKEKIVKPEERKLPEVVYTKIGEVVKAAEEKLGHLLEKEKGRGGIIEKMKEIKSEEKKLMLNVGVAALVIFALGAYVSYSFCSSSSSSSSKPE